MREIKGRMWTEKDSGADYTRNSGAPLDGSIETNFPLVDGRKNNDSQKKFLGSWSWWGNAWRTKEKENIWNSMLWFELGRQNMHWADICAYGGLKIDTPYFSGAWVHAVPLFCLWNLSCLPHGPPFRDVEDEWKITKFSFWLSLLWSNPLGSPVGNAHLLVLLTPPSGRRCLSCPTWVGGRVTSSCVQKGKQAKLSCPLSFP